MAIFIPEDKISEIKNTVDIVDIISDSVLLKKKGRNFVGLCPFHSEKTPSFTVSSEKQIFHCFGCGTGGNAFNFLMKQEGLTFPEAARALAKRYGIDIPTHALSRPAAIASIKLNPRPSFKEGMANKSIMESIWLVS